MNYIDAGIIANAKRSYQAPSRNIETIYPPEIPANRSKVNVEVNCPLIG
jgi:hypothetical protein